MPERPLQPITAHMIVEVHADSVLTEARLSRQNCRREVILILRLPDPEYKSFFEDYMLPKIANGDARDTLDRVAMLARQARITPETETRLLYLIEEFQALTK